MPESCRRTRGLYSLRHEIGFRFIGFYGGIVRYSTESEFSFDKGAILKSKSTLVLDAIDLRLLAQLQADASQSNQDLARGVHISPPTCLRRVKRLHDIGLIERQVVILNPERLVIAVGHGLTALVEVTLDVQGAERLALFERRAVDEEAVQQCYRVSSGPDFVLVVCTVNMPQYLALTQRLFTADANVRNVKSYFSVKRAKFETRLPLT